MATFFITTDSPFCPDHYLTPAEQRAFAVIVAKHTGVAVEFLATVSNIEIDVQRVEALAFADTTLDQFAFGYVSAAFEYLGVYEAEHATAVSK